MEIMRRLRMRVISSGLVMALLAPPLALAGDDHSKTDAPAPAAGATDTSTSNPGGDLPDSPGSTQSNSSQSPPATSSPAPPQQAPPAPAAQSTTHEPVGTAAAAIGHPAGVAAANPAGNAIAPAKQKRARMLVIKVGAILGAGVAIGTVAALSSGSPSHPPGSH